jgi:hypothetical protein
MEQLFLCSFFLYSKEVGVEEGKYRYSDSLWGIFLPSRLGPYFALIFIMVFIRISKELNAYCCIPLVSKLTNL